MTQVVNLTQDLRSSSLEQAVLVAKAEQEETKQKILTEEKEELRKQVEDLPLDLEKSRISRADMDSFLQEALSANDKGLNVRKAFLSLIENI